MNDSILYPRSGRDWLPYAVLELPSVAIAGAQLESWLMDTLHPLALPPDFSGKVLASARDAAARIPAEAPHIRLLVFTPAPRPPYGQTWGFFRTVKNEETRADPARSTHVIAFYLYVEGFIKLG